MFQPDSRATYRKTVSVKIYFEHLDTLAATNFNVIADSVDALKKRQFTYNESPSKAAGDNLRTKEHEAR